MAETLDLAAYATEEQRDEITLYYRQSGRYGTGSQWAMDLCDEIQRIEIALWHYRGQPISTPNEQDRSTTVLRALDFYLDYRFSQLKQKQVDAGEL